MGGGRGLRMYPLTHYRSKPAVPLGGRYRIIDVPVSNCLNSGFNKILVLTQYNSQSLNKHIFRTYKLDTFFRGYVEVLAAEQSPGTTEWFQGTADSVRRSLPHIQDPNIDEVIVLSGDQLYTMDLNELRKEHHAKGADITIACHPQSPANVSSFGIIDVHQDGRINSFIEKPKSPSEIPSAPLNINGKPFYLANMGIYIFKKEVLKEMLESSDKDDFGKEIIPDALQTRKVHAHIYNGYWSDIGTIRSYFEASLMLTDPVPAFDLYNESWQIYTRPRHLSPAKILSSQIRESILAEGCILQGATIEKSVIGIRSYINEGTVIKRCVINGNDNYQKVDKLANDASRPRLGIGSNCRIENAIIDKNARIGNNVQILNLKNADTADEAGYSIRDGIIVVHKGGIIPDNTVI